MIGITQGVLNQIAGYSGGALRDAAGGPLYLKTTSTRHDGWDLEWKIDGAPGLSCDATTGALLLGARAVNDPAYLAGCFLSTTGVLRQLVVSAGAALPGDVPDPPPPPP